MEPVCGAYDHRRQRQLPTACELPGPSYERTYCVSVERVDWLARDCRIGQSRQRYRLLNVALAIAAQPCIGCSGCGQAVDRTTLDMSTPSRHRMSAHCAGLRSGTRSSADSHTRQKKWRALPVPKM